MPQQIVIAEQLRIAAVLNDNRVDELIVAQGLYQIGDIYLGTVENVLPGIDAAFVNIGESEKNGFIHVSDLGPLKLKKGSAGITELLEPRQKVLVQVMKEPTGNKGPRLTGNISLPGRYLILQPNGQGVNISRRINSEGERNRLRALGVLIKPPGTGLLIRSEAEEVGEEFLIDDLENLFKQWDAIQQAAENCEPPVLLNRDEDFIHRILRDHTSNNLEKVIVDNSSAVERIKTFLAQDEANVVVENHSGPKDILEHFKVHSAIYDALQPRVDLPSGGYVIIEPTEALTVIDVNSGSFTRSANARETVLWTNCEASIEIARQLKLRNIGGVIIIDFIDMDSRKDQLQLLESFTSAVKDDSSRPQIAQLTELGLVELTRKRQGQNIYELFGKKCLNCGGLGHIALLPGENPIQPSAVAPGLVSSVASNKIDTQLTSDNNLKKKRIGKNKSNEENSNVLQSGLNNKLEMSINATDTSRLDSSSEIQNNKHETKLIGVPMDDLEEEVYSFLGLNPILLLEQNLEIDNFMARIIRPGEDAEQIIEESRKSIDSNSIKRKRRGRNIGIKVLDKVNLDNQSSSIDQLEIEEQDSRQDADIIDNATGEKQSLDKKEINQETSLNESETEDDEPRRRRRRSSATNENAT